MPGKGLPEKDSTEAHLRELPVDFRNRMYEDSKRLPPEPLQEVDR
jgi:hypothetical protein